MIPVRRQHLKAYRQEQGRYLIELKLRDTRQLFNTLDPSPFHEKDLDPAAEEYLVGAVREIGSRPSTLLLHVPADTSTQESSSLAPAIRHYFTYRAWHMGEQMRLLLWRGLISLLIGLLFLVACLWLRQLANELAGTTGLEFMPEGLLILGWVAMWRPVEIFLYDWWPEFGKRLLFLRIAEMNIEVLTARGGADGSLEAHGDAIATSVHALSGDVKHPLGKHDDANEVTQHADMNDGRTARSQLASSTPGDCPHEVHEDAHRKQNLQ